MNIRLANRHDFNDIWPFFKAIASAGETYAYDTEVTKKDAEVIWLEQPVKTFVVEENNQILGSYFIKTNQPGPGKHVCNCGYMVSENARGKGVATLMCNHSQEQAKLMGYTAMQFNFVAASNEVAIKLWKKCGFAEVGCLPNAFNHPRLGMVDALVMFKSLL
jgi:ribosomal protein S18 acetylase RimI-like enzyme